MFSLFSDALIACHEFRESQRFAIALVLLLATGIVAATVIFGLLEGVLLRELLFPVPSWKDLFAEITASDWRILF